MAFMNKELKNKLAPGIKAVLKAYGMKGTIATRNYSTIIVNIREGELPFDFEYRDNFTGETRSGTVVGNDNSLVIPTQADRYIGKSKEFLENLFKALNKENYDKSDAMTDYFDVGYHTEVNIGKYNKPYKLSTKK